jgi:2-polyprenyl-6-hydroxyphenyl methylase/3-demethylubiquinone-9 3-methyltransferase
MAGVDLALDVARDIADAGDIADRRAAEFHDETGHGVKTLALRVKWRVSIAADFPRRNSAGMRTLDGVLTRRRGITEKGWGLSPGQDTMAPASTVDHGEVAQFSALAKTWWDPRGKMAVLHKFNPVRLAYIRDIACQKFGRDAKRLDSLFGLRILDIGCGGGLLSEPLARLGASVVGADPSATNIEVAKLHARESELAIDYRVATAEQLAEEGERFDVVLAMEVVEHVTSVELFIDRCAWMVKPGGLLIVATLNRTLKSFALAIVGAEYILGWLPRGTHRWGKFVTPNELEIALELAGLRPIGESGVMYHPLADRWQLTSDMDVNYLMTAERE